MRLHDQIKTLTLEEAVRVVKRTRSVAMPGLWATLTRDHGQEFVEQVKEKLNEPSESGIIVSRPASNVDLTRRN